MIWTPNRTLWTPDRARRMRGPVCPRCRKPARRLRERPRWRSRVPAVNMAAGDRLLDMEGNRILDTDGKVMLDDGAGNTCCCSTGTNCFQIWQTDRDCETDTWSTPIRVGSYCLGPGATEGWHRSSNYCRWFYFVFIGDCGEIDCSASEDSPPGDLPPNFDGCCYYPGCCTQYYTITFFDVQVNADCRDGECGNGQVGHPGAALGTYRCLIVDSECDYFYSGAGPGIDFGSGSDCQTGLTSDMTMDISIARDGTFAYWYTISAANTHGSFFLGHVSIADFEAHGCCHEYTVDNEYALEEPGDHYPCGIFGVGGYAIITPGPCHD
jgi:hypothetical protein